MKSTELGNAVQNEFEAALNNEDNAELAKLMASKYNEIAKSIEAKFEELKDEHDEKVLASRGIRTLTSDEEKFYNRIFSNEVSSPDCLNFINSLSIILLCPKRHEEILLL